MIALRDKPIGALPLMKCCFSHSLLRLRRILGGVGGGGLKKGGNAPWAMESQQYKSSASRKSCVCVCVSVQIKFLYLIFYVHMLYDVVVITNVVRCTYLIDPDLFTVHADADDNNDNADRI
jgi:hypothetical protein